MSPLFIALLGSFALSALLAIAWVSALDRAERYRLGRQSIPAARELPRAVAVPTAWRNQREKARARKRT